MKTFTKAMIAALALTGSVMAISAPAKAQVSGYVGVGDPNYDGYYSADPSAEPYGAQPYDYAYADPYACDYYDPPWGYPPDYCAYQVWEEPIYVAGLWYSGPIYYRSFGGERLFWLNGGWRHDEWYGPRPGRIDWGRNMRWSGPLHHRGDFAGGNWNGRFGGNAFAGRNWNGGGNFNRGGDRGPDLGGRNNGQNFAAPNGGPRQGFDGGNLRGRVGGGNNGQNFAVPNAGPRQGLDGGNRGRFAGQQSSPRNGGAQAFTQPNNVPNNGGFRGRFDGQGGQGARGGGQSGGPRAAFQGGGPRSGGQGQGGGGFQRGGERSGDHNRRG